MKLSVALAFVSFAVAFAAALAVSGGEASAEGRDGGASGTPGSAADAGPTRDAGLQISRTPPDPPAMSSQQQWVFDLRWDRGTIYLLEVHKVDMGAPHVTPRVIGRFALELFEGPTVVERVRFDFPMLGAAEGLLQDAGAKTAPRFEPKLRTRIGVLFPAANRGTKLELWDRARDVRMALPWPPTEGPVSPDAGVP